MEIEVRKTEVFEAWLLALKDKVSRGIILRRLVRLANGNPGDVKSVGGGVSELRIDYGPGFRLYFTSQGESLVILLCGGDKSSQDRDIERARFMASEI